MKVITGTLSWVLLAVLGLTSAILCIAPPLLRGVISILYVGTVYGLLLAVYFVTCRGIRSATRLITLVAVSAVSWPIAYFGSFWGAGVIPGGTVRHGDGADPAFPLIAFGGVLGGLALLTPVLLLFKPSSVRSGTALFKALFGILLSGVVGAIAWVLGPTLGAAIWGLLPTAPLPQPDSYGTAAVFFVWQPVIALFIGWATFERQSSLPIQVGKAQPQVRTLATQASGAFYLRAFALILTTLVILLLTRIVPVRLRLAHREQATAKMRESRPLAVDLPVAQPMSEDEAVILKQIGDYKPGRAVKRMEFVSHEKGFERPSTMYFNALYTKTGEPVPEWSAAPVQYISVVVEQYPNNAWAQYFAAYPPNRYNSFDNPKQHAIVAQFNNKVRSNQFVRSPGQTWYPLYYIWPSGNCVITAEYNTSDEDLEIVQAYLEKYPSSITDSN